jgi:hypothetical protein
MQTGQNSIAPENSLPQLKQMRRDSVFMDQTVFEGDKSFAKSIDLLLSLQRQESGT